MTPFDSAEVPGMAALSGGVPVTLGGVTVKGIVDPVEVPILQGQGGQQYGRLVAVHVPVGSLPALAIGASIVAIGATWRVLEAQEVPGPMTRIVCAEP